MPEAAFGGRHSATQPNPYPPRPGRPRLLTLVAVHLTHVQLAQVLAAEAHRERLDRFAEPKPLEQRDLLLCAGGYRYEGVSAPVAELAYEDFKRAADRT